MGTVGRDVVIVAAVRTPIGRIRGALSTVRPDDLGAVAIRAAVERSGVEPGRVDEVIFGCANQAGEDNRNVARMAALLAGLPQEIAAVTVNRLCASGLNAVNQAARAIACGEAEVMVAGGVESMTRAPYSFPKNPSPFGPSGNVTGWDTTLGWRYPNPRLEAMFPLDSMGETAENVVEESRNGTYGGIEITREMQDCFALTSQQRAADAMSAGRFADELVPVPIDLGRGRTALVEIDEHPRVRREGDGYVVDTDLDELARLRPAFRDGGSVTAGNSSGLNDGASAVVLTSAAHADATGLTPLARWVGSTAVGVDPRVMGIGPVPATRRLLQRLGLQIGDLDLIELNEAFAAQSVAVVNTLGLDPSIVNVNGGAIALGHPLGSSGGRILATLVHEMRRRRAAGERMRYGLATLCVGVGQGEATVVEIV